MPVAQRLEIAFPAMSTRVYGRKLVSTKNPVKKTTVTKTTKKTTTKKSASSAFEAVVMFVDILIWVIQRF